MRERPEFSLIPFDFSPSRPGYVFCSRCEDWILASEVWGLYCDPHIEDHREAYRLMQNIEQRLLSNA